MNLFRVTVVVLGACVLLAQVCWVVRHSQKAKATSQVEEPRSNHFNICTTQHAAQHTQQTQLIDI
jgi:negative regulator of sigma E activity